MEYERFTINPVALCVSPNGGSLGLCRCRDGWPNELIDRANEEWIR